MDITVIISEYNPFHNGHLFHIAKTKESFPDTSVVCLMSGSFVQRGEPAVALERERAIWAIKAGADAVIRLPLFSSFSDGENFALSAIKTAVKIGASKLSFGSESGDINLLKEIADILDEQSPTFKDAFDSKMSAGLSYPRAICEVMNELYPDKNYSNTLKNPNDILGVLYLKALKGTGIEPYCVKRSDNGYDSPDPKGRYLSASAIREKIAKGESASDYLPDFVRLTYRKSINNDLSALVLYKLRTIPTENLKSIQDVTEGLENRLKRFASTALSLDDFLSKVKTKRYTMSRLKRILLFVLFDVTKKKFNEYKSADYCRLLAIDKSSSELLSHLNKKGVVMKYSDLNDLTKIYWEEENKMSDAHELLLQKSDIRNAVFV